MQVYARSCAARIALEGEQAIEEGTVASECLPQILGRRLIAVEAMFKVGPLVAEQLLQFVEYLSDQLVRASYSTTRIVDELALELIPPTVVAFCPLRLDECRALTCAGVGLTISAGLGLARRGRALFALARGPVGWTVDVGLSRL